MNRRQIICADAYSTDHSEETSVSRFVFTYLVIAILIFLAMGGYLPTYAGRASSLVSTVSASDTFLGQAFQGGMWGIACLLMVSCWKEIVRTCFEMKTMMALSLLAPLSALWSQDPANSLRRGVFLVLGTLFAFYLVRKFATQYLAQVFVMAGVFAGVIGIMTSIFLPRVGIDSFNEGAWQGIFRSKNGCSQVMLFLMTPAVAITFSTRFMNLMRYLLFVLTAILLVMSNAKTAWLLAPGYLLLMGGLSWLKKMNRRDALFLLLAGCTCFLVFVVSFAYMLPLILESLGKDPTISGRTHLWASAMLSIFKRPLLGYGYASFWTGMRGESLNIFMTTHFEIYQAQNGILEIWLELGLIGVVLVLITLVAAGRDALTCFQYGHTNAVNWSVGLIALTIAYNVDETFLASAHSLPWLLYIVACTRLAAEAKKLRFAATHRSYGKNQKQSGRSYLRPALQSAFIAPRMSKGNS